MQFLVQCNTAFLEETDCKKLPLRRLQPSTVDLSGRRLVSTGITDGILLIVITILITRSLLLLLLLLLAPLLVAIGYSIDCLFKEWKNAHDHEAQDYHSETTNSEPRAKDSGKEVTTV